MTILLSSAAQDELRAAKWLPALNDAFSSDSFYELLKKINYDRSGTNVYPPKGDVFNALKITPLNQVKVVIIGQDPYHGHGQANGLAFGTNSMIRPPSLRNIIKEIEFDFGIQIDSKSNTLTGWAKQGVLLLNTVLTVEGGRPGSHVGIGWEEFTSEVIRAVAVCQKNVVFVLWGNQAKKLAPFIRSVLRYDRGIILESGHPSPLSARYFFGNGHFRQINEYLIGSGLNLIDWAMIDANTQKSDFDVLEQEDKHTRIWGLSENEQY